MKNEKAIKLISTIDEKYIDEALSYGQNESNKPATENKQGHGRVLRFRWVAAAAAIILIVVTGFAIHNVSAEAKEYAEAVEYFKTNGMSTEGLSRTEIKETYRMIKTTKTVAENGELAKHGDAQPDDTEITEVPGLEIDPERNTNEENQKIVEQKKWTEVVDGYYYHTDFYEKYEGSVEEGTRRWVSEESTITCSYGTEKLWTVKLPCSCASINRHYKHLQGKTVIWGWVGEKGNDYLIAAVSDEGELLWSSIIPYDENHVISVIYDMIDGGDGSVEIVSDYTEVVSGEPQYNGLGITRFDKDGNKIAFNSTEFDTNIAIYYGEIKAAKFGDGYLVSGYGDTESYLFALDKDWNVLNRVTFGEEGYEYWIRDIIEYQGKVVLSAYAIPRAEIDIDSISRYDYVPWRSDIMFAFRTCPRIKLKDIRDYIGDNYIRDDSSSTGKRKPLTDGAKEGLTQVVRDTFKAILLVCDPEDSTPKTFCYVQGAVGSGLHCDESGHLFWDIRSIETTGEVHDLDYVAYCKVLRYAFDPDFTLLGQSDTGETVRFYSMPEIVLVPEYDFDKVEEYCVD